MSELFSRRSFLKISGIVAVSAALAACSGGDGGSISGGGSTGGGSTGGGSVDTTQYYNVGDGLQIRGSVGIGSSVLNGVKYPFLSLTFKNTSAVPLTINVDQFTEVYFDGNPVSAIAVKRQKGQFIRSLEIADNDTAAVSLYLNAASATLEEAGQKVSFCYSHNGSTKVRCSGEYRLYSIYTITTV